MRTASSYHRPATIEEALTMLGTEGALALSGGTVVNAGDGSSVADLVDLQDVVPASIEERDGRVTLGAMVRLQDLVDAVDFPPLLRELARREAPSTIRNAATIGGTVAAADPESELLAGLLVYEAEVTVVSEVGPRTVSLSDLLASGVPAGQIIVSISVAAGGEGAVVRTGRTPADVPIVAAVGRRAGEISSFALTGVAATPLLLEPDDLDTLNPLDDFRGSGEYRRHLARVLLERIADELGGVA